MNSQLNYDPNSTARFKHRRRQFQHFLIKVGIIYVALSIVLYLVFSNILINRAYQDIADDELRQFSQMVFESSLTAMLAEEKSEDIKSAAKRMQRTGPGMVVSIIQSEGIDQLYGEDKIDHMRRVNDLNIFNVFKNAEENTFRKDDVIRFLYPVLFKNECLFCHTNAQAGEVSGVVELIYPVKNPKVSTRFVNHLMIGYFVASFIVLLIILGWSYQHGKRSRQPVNNQ